MLKKLKGLFSVMNGFDKFFLGLATIFLLLDIFVYVGMLRIIKDLFFMVFVIAMPTIVPIIAEKCGKYLKKEK